MATGFVLLSSAAGLSSVSQGFGIRLAHVNCISNRRCIEPDALRRDIKNAESCKERLY